MQLASLSDFSSVLSVVVRPRTPWPWSFFVVGSASSSFSGAASSSWPQVVACASAAVTCFSASDRLLLLRVDLAHLSCGIVFGGGRVRGRRIQQCSFSALRPLLCNAKVLKCPASVAALPPFQSWQRRLLAASRATTRSRPHNKPSVDR